MWTENDDRIEERVRNGLGAVNSVAVNDDRIAPVPSAAAATPSISNLNVNNSKKVHIGPKFVSVTQNVQNQEVVKGRFLGLELVSPNNARTLRCSVAVFVCWAFLVASGLAIYLLYMTLLKHQTRLDIGLTESWFLRREDWLALPSYSEEFLVLPVSSVIIGHSVSKYCNQKFACVEQMLSIQQDHLSRRWLDIGPNFLVGGNGLVFEGRGANILGVMVSFWNRRSITIMFIGNYVNDVPDDAQFQHVNILLKRLVELGVLTPNFIVYAQCQVQPLTVPPGRHLLRSMDKIIHWKPLNITGCLSR
ncbi:peptidoglycan-recognition protein SB2-like isoform X3 [Pieris napi]|uniref:peptidoglycan-recognition protein SB2-like isoform X3 n=1 Tax=Pieris napi TaxID=78633 RepID=UPI001FB90588|nr:peptidoglycan-recognition protein SB2-like isoform X3 [Pieris napi]